MTSTTNKQAVKTFLNPTDSSVDTAYDSIRIENRNPSSYLDISLRRTLRASDDGKEYKAPPDCGHFPIYSIDEFKDALPRDIGMGCVCLVPVYQREAMWINFQATQPFTIKVFADRINVISGDRADEDKATVHSRRKTKKAEKERIQDYVVSQNQKWLHGITKRDGTVKQITATPTKSGYSAKAQVPKDNRSPTSQFEIIPVKYTHPIWLQIIIQDENGAGMAFRIKYKSKLRKLFDAYCEKKGVFRGSIQFLDSKGSRMWDYYTPNALGMKPGDIAVTLPEHVVSQRGFSDPRPWTPFMKVDDTEAITAMVKAAGGLVKQPIAKDDLPAKYWDVENTVFISVRLVGVDVFRKVTGVDPPETSVTVALYEEFGYPSHGGYEASEVGGGSQEQEGVVGFETKRVLRTSARQAEKHLSSSAIKVGEMKRTFVPTSQTFDSKRIERAKRKRNRKRKDDEEDE